MTRIRRDSIIVRELVYLLIYGTSGGSPWVVCTFSLYNSTLSNRLRNFFFGKTVEEGDETLLYDISAFQKLHENEQRCLNLVILEITVVLSVLPRGSRLGHDQQPPAKGT